MFFKKKNKFEPVDFLILYAGFAIGAVIFFSFPYNLLIRKLIVIYLGVYYFAWGVWHHKKRGEFCVKIGLEYLLFAILGTSIILSTILRG